LIEAAISLIAAVISPRVGTCLSESFVGQLSSTTNESSNTDVFAVFAPARFVMQVSSRQDLTAVRADKTTGR
jgi:hypothetical protein